jgi:two-component system OmpR family sensor kinase
MPEPLPAGAAAPAPEAAAAPPPDGALPPAAPPAPLPRPWSLEQRIRWRLVLVVATCWLAGSLISTAGVWHVTGTVLDSALSETAERFLYLPDSVLDDSASDTRYFAEIPAHEEHVIYQVYDRKGEMRLRSHDAPLDPLDPGAADGIRDFEDWRVLTMTRADGQRRIQVAERIDMRFAVLWGSVGWLIGSLLLVLPAVSLVMALVLRKGFEALEPVRAALGRRDRDDWRPIANVSAPQELQPWLESVNALIAHDRVLIDAERSFAARTAHELRTPVAAARAQAQRLVQLTQEGPARQGAESLVRALDRLTRLATRLLQLARIESQAKVRREPVDLAMLGRMVVAEFADAVASERLRIIVDSESTGVIGDIDAIGIALRNLIDNALKHGGRNSWVTVLVETLSIMVINDGPGVPPEILHKLIRPFERGITAAEGSGLGLSITHAIAAQAGGTLELRSPLLGDTGFAAILRFD